MHWRFLAVATVTAGLLWAGSAIANPGPRPRCFGAASIDREQRCHNPRLATLVTPSPTAARTLPPSACGVVAHDPGIDVCSFGAPQAAASGTIALLGDSHAQHWRPAVDGLARARNWYAYSIALGGCPYSTATRDIPEPLLTACHLRNSLVPSWFEQHPEVHTVFLAQISGVRWLLPAGERQFEGQVRHYIEAWSQLPPTVTHIVVIRDTPKAERGTRTCIRHAMARRAAAGVVCRVPRRVALSPDPAVEAARRLATPRIQVVSVTRSFCDSRWCYPVIGGALVQKDINHLTPVFVSTLTPYLIRAVDALPVPLV